MFVSPLGEMAQMAIVIDSGSHEALVTHLHRHHLMADKHGELIPSTCHSLLAEDVPAPRAQLASSAGRATAPVERWMLSVSGQGTPTHFLFCSLILMVNKLHIQACLKVVLVMACPLVLIGVCSRLSLATRSEINSSTLTTRTSKGGCTPAPAEHCPVLGGALRSRRQK
jgi:hypothetical protein